MDTKNPSKMSDAVSTGIRGLGLLGSKKQVEPPRLTEEVDFEDTEPQPTLESLQEEIRELRLELSRLGQDFLTHRVNHGRA